MTYKFYATLLDTYQGYVDSDLVWEQYWGQSESPRYTPDEFREAQFQSLIDRVNRVKKDSEAADRGTAFNDIIDSVVLHLPPQREEVSRVYDSDYRLTGFNVRYNNRDFYFPYRMVREVSDYYRGAVTQEYVEAPINTMYGDVLLYGFPDYIMPGTVHDLKTTGQYKAGKFRRHWQHVVYPYILDRDGMLFEYNIVEMRGDRWDTYTETYAYSKQRDVPRLRMFCEELIEFLEEHRDLITDRKVFGEEQQKEKEIVLTV